MLVWTSYHCSEILSNDEASWSYIFMSGCATDRYWSNASKIIVIDICYVCGWICSYLPVSIRLLLYILCNWSGSGIFYSCLFSNYFLRKLWVLFLFFLLATFYIVLNLLDLNNLLLHYTKLDEAPLLLFLEWMKNWNFSLTKELTIIHHLLIFFQAYLYVYAIVLHFCPIKNRKEK